MVENSRKLVVGPRIITQSKANPLYLFEGSEWSDDNDSSSCFESLLLSDSSAFSPGYKSMVSEDLNLYDAECICQLPT